MTAAAGKSGYDERVGDLIVTECARTVVVQVQCADADLLDEQGKPERGANPGRKRAPPELRPPHRSFTGKVGVEDRDLGSVGRYARPFAQRVLHLLDGFGPVIGDADEVQRPTPRHQDETGAGNAQNLDARDAQGAGRTRVLARMGSNNLCEPFGLKSGGHGSPGLVRRLNVCERDMDRSTRGVSRIYWADALPGSGATPISHAPYTSRTQNAAAPGARFSRSPDNGPATS